MSAKCELCGKKFGFLISAKDIEKCSVCRKPYHVDCFKKKRNAVRIPAKVAVLIFSKRRQRVIDSAMELKSEQFNLPVSRIETWSEEQILDNVRTKVCRFCADEAKVKSIEVAKQLEVARRYGEALMIYDQFDMFEDAGRVRGSVMGQTQLGREVYTKEITKEIVKIPCKYCGSLNVTTDKKCHSCGASV